MTKKHYSVVRRLGSLFTVKSLAGQVSTLDLKEYDYGDVKTGDMLMVELGAFDFVGKISFRDCAKEKPEWVELIKKPEPLSKEHPHGQYN